jgi:hypothetical protein
MNEILTNTMIPRGEQNPPKTDMSSYTYGVVATTTNYQIIDARNTKNGIH